MPSSPLLPADLASPEVLAPGGTVKPRLGAILLIALGVVVATLLAAVHVTQGSANVGVTELIGLLFGGSDDQSAAVLVASRMPRLAAGVLIGVALGVAGLVMQSVTRNVLASPDTLAVNAGSYLAIVAVAAFGVALPVVGGGAVAFAGGLAAAGLVLGLSAGGVGGGRGGGTVRLVLAGSAIALALDALTTMLLLLHPERTEGLYAWSKGTLAQTGMTPMLQLGPVVLLGVAALFLFARQFDLMALGDDTATVLGVRVRRTRLIGILIAVLLSAAAVTVAGPIGFVGLAAPAIVRLIAARVPGMQKHVLLIPAAAVMGVVIVLGADVLLRLAFGGQAAVEVPTGVVTTIFGAVFLIALALRARASSDSGTGFVVGAGLSHRGRRLVLVASAVLLVLLAFVSLLLGDAKLLGGDVLNWITGQAGPLVEFVMNTRAPRVAAAILAGAALALAGTVVQAVSRNPLAEPAILGVTGGAGVGAVLVITLWPLATFLGVTLGGLAGAALAAAIVFGLALRGGLASTRLILIGLGVSAAAGAITSMLIIATDPYNAAKALTWMSGSTYGRTFPQLVPLLVVVLISVPLLASARRELDLLAFDDDTPRVLGVRLGSARLGLLAVSVALTATAVSAVGVIGFVGLVAPHAARALVGSRHALVLPLAALLGAVLVCVADTLGRTLIAPGQLPAGLLTAVVGAPYFVWLLWRSRGAA
ncbi:iron ABC transporter permease [Agromyces ramosus]|uniref:ABC-type Fe3+-siderophore transport system permease subunit n=1 Tax=Agromyces ramosus TaxID=33879 RepID=A0ABU0RBP8_9MICO|nr:iron ABC transporter permease [Agromyces ramosus]MDQ0895503.1 ABC-type Fe3+-siderophore transport system permease subunit [Agromyces ramosus]